MYVSYLQLDKDPAMYPAHQNSVSVTRHPSLSLSPQSFPPPPPQYSDFTAYHHHHQGLNSELQPGQGGSGGGWSSAYAHPHPHPPHPPSTREHHHHDWSSSHHYSTTAAGSGSTAVGSTLGFSPPEFPGLPPGALSVSGGQLSPGSPQRSRNPYDWMRRSSAPPSCNPNGKTRTKDKYRVVYTDHQRLELEKEFHYSKYITIRRKAELATSLGLSERQVKIWFQNRRAKERKINKKKLQQPASSTSTPPGSANGSAGGGLHGNNNNNNNNGGGGGNNVGMVTSSSGNNNHNNNNNNNGLVSPSSMPLNIKEEY